MQRELFPNLSESHRCSIRITLTLLDEALCRFAEWAQGREVRSVLYAQENDLSTKQREGILADVGGIHQILMELRETLALETKPQSVPRAIRASCYILWVNITEITGRYLRGHGEPPKELVEYLDPKLHRILEYLDHIKRLLSDDFKGLEI